MKYDTNEEIIICFVQSCMRKVFTPNARFVYIQIMWSYLYYLYLVSE